jgi:hypothetical protein
MEHNVKYIVTRLVLLFVLLLSFAWGYKQYFWQADLIEYADQLPEVWQKSDSCDILYFAESSNASNAESDSIKMSISDLIALHFPGKILGAVNKGAVHAGVFLPLIQQIPEGSRVKTIIITMNLRSFDAAWINSKLETSLMKSNVMYEQRHPFVNKLMMSFGYYDHKTESQRDLIREHSWRYDTLIFPFEYPYKTVRAWDNGFANGYYKNADSTWDLPKIGLACHYIKAYAFQIDPNTNPRIRDFDEIVKVAKAKKLNVVFNLLAENVEYADSLVGPPLTFLMRQNRDLLVKRYHKDGVVVVDNLESVPGKQYIDQEWTTEHYFYEGRKRIADNLAAHIKVF